MIDLTEFDEQILLHRSKIEASFHGAVASLARLAAEGEDGDIGLTRLVLDAGARERQFGNGRLHVPTFGGIAVALELRTAESLIGSVHLLEIARHFQPGVCQALLKIHHVGLHHIARSGSACHEVERGEPEEGHFLDIIQRKHAACVLQQHHALGGRAAGDGGMRLEVGVVTVLIITEVGSLHDILQHTAHRCIKVGHGEAAVLQHQADVLQLHLIARLQIVYACLYLRGRVPLLYPIGHHDTVKSPLVTQDGGQQFGAFLCVGAVQAIVRCHHRPGARFFHGNLKPLQIDFTQGTLRYDFVHLGAVGFL